MGVISSGALAWALSSYNISPYSYLDAQQSEFSPIGLDSSGRFSTRSSSEQKEKL